MSIEKNIERIADALEALVGMAQKADVSGPVNPPPAPPTVSAPVDTIPGADNTPAVTATVEDNGTVKTGSELRNLAQKYIQVAGDKTGSLVSFIRGLCEKINPKEPKLIKIPDSKVAEVAKAIEEFCAKNGIGV